MVFITSLGKFFITPNMLGTILSIYKWIKYGLYAEGTKKKYITQAMYVIVFIYLLKIHTFIYLLNRQFKPLRGTASHRFFSQWLWQKDSFGIQHKPCHCFHECELLSPHHYFVLFATRSHYVVLCIVHVSASLA